MDVLECHAAAQSAVLNSSNHDGVLLVEYVPTAPKRHCLHMCVLGRPWPCHFMVLGIFSEEARIHQTLLPAVGAAGWRFGAQTAAGASLAPGL